MKFESLDLLVILLYICGIFIMAFWAGSSKREDSGSVEQQYLAGKSLTYWESLSSIIATEVSALTFLGIPAFAYSNNYSFLHIYLGAILGRFVIAKILLPRVYDKGLTIYEVMRGEGNSIWGQRLTSLFFVIAKFLSIGVRLYAGSILVGEFFQIPTLLAVFIITAMTFVYTLIGGLKAVVRTDMVQMLLFILGGILAHLLIPQISKQSWSDLMLMASNHGKTSLVDLQNIWPFIAGILGGFLFDIGTHGTDQDFIQRLTANRSLKGAQLAIATSSFFSIFVALLFLGVGSLLWAHYQTHPLPEGLVAKEVFAHFITHYFPSGIKGLMVAGVLAATMSTLDSTMNAIGSCLFNDIIPNRNPNKIKRYFFTDTLFVSFMFYLVAIASSKSQNILTLGLTVQSWTAGPLLGLFFATIFLKGFQKHFDATMVLGAYLFGILGVLINHQWIQGVWTWNTYWGMGLSLLFILIRSKIKETIKT